MGTMVHHVQPERTSRKRDRRTAGLSYGSSSMDSTGHIEGSNLAISVMPGPPILTEILPPPPKVIRLGMYDTYQPWVLQTYGDQAKTKTITKNKYQRILQILRGDYLENETSKFKLWVKGRGFRIGPPPGYFHPTLMNPCVPNGIEYNTEKDSPPDIYVQTGTIKDVDGNDRVCFKKVAVVEDFFDIVYNLHVCRDGKEEKHMGQKRTYRAVSERYAFVPREAVTKFLVLCSECPRRSSGVPASLRNANNNKNSKNNNNNHSSNKVSTPSPKKGHNNPPEITSSLGPFTTHSLGASLLRSPILNVSLPSNHYNLLYNTTPPKTKNNFSSVVSLAGKDEEEGKPEHHFSPSNSLHLTRNGHVTFKPNEIISSLTSLASLPSHTSQPNKTMFLDTTKLSPIPFQPILQSLCTTASSVMPVTPPPQANILHSPEKPIKSEPPSRASLFTPDSQAESFDRSSAFISRLNIDSVSVPVKREEPDYRSEFLEIDEEGKREISTLSSEMDYSLPITTLYMKHIQSKKRRHAYYNTEENNNILKDVPNIGESDGSEDELKNVMEGKKNDQGRNLKEWSPYSSNQQEQQQPLSLRKSDSRRSPCVSPSSGDGCTSLSTPMEITGSLEETSSNGNKDEEDDENEDDPEDERIDAQYDPERLKAFNMFVRLFVDENLDRIVPISKQPKEKIQAIIDACARQFPEFADRTRKRIRTYLKSCRRNKRARDSNGWENSRPTPPHLTSIQAEQILATACENEAQNAKRMRLGLEPVSQNNHFTSQSTPVSQTTANNEHRPLIIDSSPGKIDSVVSSSSANVLGKTLERSTLDPKTNNIHAGIFSNSYQSGFSKSPLTCNTIGSQNSSSMFLPGGSTASVTSPTSSSALGAAVSLSSTGSIQMVANGPTDLSLKGTSSKSSVTRPSLNPIEVAAVRQLITGYRESAAFLLRSADELESLLTHQQSTSS